MTWGGVQSRPTFAAGGTLSILGATLAVIHVAHGVAEYPTRLLAIAYGVVLPLLVALVLTGAGYWVVRREWTEVTPWRLVGWTVGGVVVGAAVIVLLILYQHTEGGYIADPEFTMAMFATYGGFGGMLVGRYDVQRKERRLQREREAVRLDEFAQLVSHDLRNPLNVAMGRVELLQREYDDDNLDATVRALERMERLIEDLLALAREGDAAISTERIDLGDRVQRCWANVATGPATLQLETEQLIRADPARFDQLLENLFRNAIDHGGEDVTVAVGALEDGFYVEDDGPGIPEADRSKVFDRGFTTTPQGTGYGLSIVEEAVDAHDWQIDVTDGADGGARFEITGVAVLSTAEPLAANHS